MAGNLRKTPSTPQKPKDAKSTRYAKREEKTVKPFLKWAGGKGQLLCEIEKYYPFMDGKVTKYAEPFVGGGAVLFDILSRYDLEEIYISDINAELINTYCMIRDNIDALINILSNLQSNFLPLDTDDRKAYYMKQRNRFNELKINGDESIHIEKAALIIFLNKTCFNGLFRVNRKGLFNVPIGAYKNPMICDETNLRSVSEKLQKVTIVCGDYRESASFIDENTFVYFDPPYRPLTDTANFTAYTENLFNDKEQIELAKFVNEMDSKGAKIVISNSDPKNANTKDNFFDNIYASYKIKRVQATRMINCNGEARGKIRELLISNNKRGLHMEIRQGTQRIEKGMKKAIIDFVIDDYNICVFQGKLSPFDIVIKYKKDGKRIRTPKHIHWVVDILMKLQGNEALTKKYLLAIQHCWNTCTPLANNDFDTLKALIERGQTDIDIEQYFALNAFGEYNVKFLYVLMELLAVQEKTNRADAYMFGRIIEQLLKDDRDIFKIVSTAGFGGNRG